MSYIDEDEKCRGLFLLVWLARMSLSTQDAEGATPEAFVRVGLASQTMFLRVSELLSPKDRSSLSLARKAPA